jgi:hypothetical protein
MLYASCHCGAVLLEIARKPRQLTECNCSICRRYGGLWDTTLIRQFEWSAHVMRLQFTFGVMEPLNFTIAKPAAA